MGVPSSPLLDPARPYYVSIDMDAVDPVFAPGVSVPVLRGFTSRQILDIVHQLSAYPLVGADVVELAPPYDVANNTALLAAHVVFALLMEERFTSAVSSS